MCLNLLELVFQVRGSNLHVVSDIKSKVSGGEANWFNYCYELSR